MIANNFNAVFKKIEKAVNNSSNQAMNKALTNTKTLYAKNVSAILGVPSARVKQRAKINKVNSGSNIGSIDIGIRVKFAAQDFSPSKTKVESSRGKRTGVAIKIGKGSQRVNVQGGAFMATAKNGKKIVINRVNDARYPTTTVLLNVFVDTVNQQLPELKLYLLEAFNKNLKSQLDFNLSKD